MAMRAFNYLDSRELSYRNYLLLNDLVFQDPVFGPIRAKRGFNTNYASIDVLKKLGMFAFYAMLADYGDYAATIHDWLYSGYGIERADGTVYYPTRKECDEILKRALIAEGVDKFRAEIFYLGVRLGGQSHYTAKSVMFVPEEIA